ncbi:hypothetical protein [Shinella sp. BYT-45]|uniref:hypothetical protein n=1 Tax=Shinella sp. BYT-45 TaxID=3377377 RepID=UPI00397FAE3B
MNTALSDLLKVTQASLRGRAGLRLFLRPCEVRNLVKRFNTFIALAEDLEDDLHLRELRDFRDQAQAGGHIVRFPGRTLVLGTPDEQGGTP